MIIMYMVKTKTKASQVSKIQLILHPKSLVKAIGLVEFVLPSIDVFIIRKRQLSKLR